MIQLKHAWQWQVPLREVKEIARHTCTHLKMLPISLGPLMSPDNQRTCSTRQPPIRVRVTKAYLCYFSTVRMFVGLLVEQLFFWLIGLRFNYQLWECPWGRHLTPSCLQPKGDVSIKKTWSKFLAKFHAIVLLSKDFHLFLSTLKKQTFLLKEFNVEFTCFCEQGVILWLHLHKHKTLHSFKFATGLYLDTSLLSVFNWVCFFLPLKPAVWGLHLCWAEIEHNTQDRMEVTSKVSWNSRTAPLSCFGAWRWFRTAHRRTDSPLWLHWCVNLHAGCQTDSSVCMRASRGLSYRVEQLCSAHAQWAASPDHQLATGQTWRIYPKKKMPWCGEMGDLQLQMHL